VPRAPCPRPGGFKLWEGSLDLAAYLAASHNLTAGALWAKDAPSKAGLEVSTAGRARAAGPGAFASRGGPGCSTRRART
jgi:hypothetical protein